MTLHVGHTPEYPATTFHRNRYASFFKRWRFKKTILMGYSKVPSDFCDNVTRCFLFPHLLVIQNLAKGKVFQSHYVIHRTGRLFKLSQEKKLHARILKRRSYNIVSLATLLLCFQSDCRTHVNNPRLLLVIYII